MGNWVTLTELGEKRCTSIKIKWSSTDDIDNSGNYNFTREYGVKGSEWGTWGSGFRFDLTAKNVCDYNIKGGADTFYAETSNSDLNAETYQGEYNGKEYYITYDGEYVQWEWTEPVYYYGFAYDKGEFDPEPIAADFIYVMLEETEEPITIADNLNRIIQAKAYIKEAIENKGVIVGDITLDGYAEKIGEIPQTEKWVVPNGIKFKESYFTSLDKTHWDTSNVTDMKQMFYYCSYLTTLDISSWNVSNVTDMGEMFAYCSKLTSLDLSSWNLKSGVKINNMFDYCSNLTTLDISGWDLSKVSGELSLYDSSDIVNLKFGYNHKHSLDLTRNNHLTKDSLLSVLNGLYDFTGNSEKPSSVEGILRLSTSNMGKLYEEEKRIAENKGWTLSGLYD